MELDDLEEMYYEWLDEECKCNIEEDGCSCLKLDDWLDNFRLEQELTNCDF